MGDETLSPKGVISVLSSGPSMVRICSSVAIPLRIGHEKLFRKYVPGMDGSAESPSPRAPRYIVLASFGRLMKHRAKKSPFHAF